MRKLAYLLIAPYLLLVGCGKEVLDFRNAEISGNRIYGESSNEPFSGRVTNLPLNGFPTPKLGALISATGNEGVKAAVVGLLFGGSAPVTCDAEVDDGRLDGDVVCESTKTGNKIFHFIYQAGAPVDEIEIFDPKESKLIAKAPLKDGELNGLSQIFSPETGRKVNEMTWVDGVSEGPMRSFDPESENLVLSATTKGGSLDGELLRFAPDGKTVIRRAHFSRGQQEGLDEEFDLNGKLIKSVNFHLGVEVDEPSGPVELAGSAPEDVEASDPANEACVTLWMDAYRKDVGDDAVVTMDQLAEWEDWCKSGRTPESPEAHP